MKKRRRKSHSKKLLLSSSCGILIIFIAVVIATERKLSQLVLGGLGERFSTTIWSAPFEVYSNPSLTKLPISPKGLLQRLQNLRYQKIDGIPREPGEFNWTPPQFTIYLRGFSFPSHKHNSQLVRLTSLSKNWKLEDESGQELEDISLEPQLIAELSGPQKVRREPAHWEEIPVMLTDAVVAVEDNRFYSHGGLSFRSLLRAAWVDLKSLRLQQGGSTITQQLAKNLFLSPERTWRRKIVETLFALYLDVRLSKENILTLYLNHIYMGQDGTVSIAGVKAAASYYFDEKLDDLRLDECALLAGLIRSPLRYNPYKNPKNAIERRNFALRQMLKSGLLGEKEYNAAIKAPLKTKKHIPSKINDHEYFVAEVIRELLPRYGEETLFRYGLKIYTTLDPLLDDQAQKAISKTQYQAALVSLDPNTGHILTVVGGKDFKESQFNRATQALRQPGSAFKPFVYGAALEKSFTPGSLLNDKRTYYPGAQGKKWAPKNFDGVYRGSIPLRYALAFSLNAATVDLAYQIGVHSLIQFARKLGIKSELKETLGLAIGTSEVTLLELTAAYAPFANGGMRVNPEFVTHIMDAEGNLLELKSLEREAVIPPSLSFLMTSLLQTVVKEGTAKSLTSWGWPYLSAGKTGTTNEGKDGWFIGYTPELLTGVWVGDDQAKAISISGASQALPIWAQFMKQAFDDSEPSTFPQPQNIVTVKIDPVSGFLARSGCPEKKDEVFRTGTEPTKECPIHAGGIKGWFKNIFGGN